MSRKHECGCGNKCGCGCGGCCSLKSLLLFILLLSRFTHIDGCSLEFILALYYLCCCCKDIC